MVTVFLANGFEEMEALAPIDLLRRAGVSVQTAAVGTNPALHGGRIVTGAHGVPVLCDISVDQLSAEEMEMLILPGGGLGTENLDRSAQVDQWLRYADEHGIFVGAICAAPSILGKRGLLNGRKATAYPGCGPEGAVIDGSSVVQDGSYITAKGAGVCLEFALRLVACLKGEPAAQAVKDEIQCQR